MIEEHVLINADGGTLDELNGRIENISARVANLEDWQKRQNGTIYRVEEKVDKMMYLHYTELAVILGALLAWLQSAMN